MTPEAHHETVLETTGAQARIARVYAEALMASAAKTGEAELVGDELAAVVHGVLEGHPAISAFLDSGAIGRKAKQPVLAAGFDHGLSEVFRKFIGVLNQNGRLSQLKAIHAAYSKLRDKAANRVRVRVVSATALDEQQMASLKATLKDKLQAEPVFDATTDPNLLGGLVVQVGDRVYDTSVRSRLETLRTHLMTSGTHGA